MHCKLETLYACVRGHKNKSSNSWFVQLIALPLWYHMSWYVTRSTTLRPENVFTTCRSHSEQSCINRNRFMSARSLMFACCTMLSPIMSSSPGSCTYRRELKSPNIIFGPLHETSDQNCAKSWKYPCRSLTGWFCVCGGAYAENNATLPFRVLNLSMHMRSDLKQYVMMLRLVRGAIMKPTPAWLLWVLSLPDSSMR